MGGHIWQRQAKQEGRHTHGHFSKVHTWPFPRVRSLLISSFPPPVFPRIWMETRTTDRLRLLTLMTNKPPSNAISFSSCQPLPGTVLSNIWICSTASEAKAHAGSAGSVEEGGQEESGPRDWNHVTKSLPAPFQTGTGRSKRTCDLEAEYYFHSSQGFDPRRRSTEA